VEEEEFFLARGNGVPAKILGDIRNGDTAVTVFPQLAEKLEA